MRNLNQRKRERFQKILAQSEEKEEMYQEFDQLLQDIYGKKKQSKPL